MGGSITGWLSGLVSDVDGSVGWLVGVNWIGQLIEWAVGLWVSRPVGCIGQWSVGWSVRGSLGQ